MPAQARHSCQHNWDSNTLRGRALGPAGRLACVWIRATYPTQPLLCIPPTFQDGSKGHSRALGSGEQASQGWQGALPCPTYSV